MDRDKMKEYRWAMNGRMMLMLLGIMLIVNGILVNGRYGVNFFLMAADAASGKEESLKILTEAGISISWLRIVAIGFILITVAEVFTGVICFRFCNRIDRSDITMKFVIALLVLEVLFQIFLISQRMASLGGILSALVVPAFLLWSVRGFRKLAQLYPDRVYALEQYGKGGPAAGKRTAGAQTPKKSLKERAAVPRNLGEAKTNSTGSGEKQADAARQTQNVTPAWAIAQWEKDSADQEAADPGSSAEQGEDQEAAGLGSSAEQGEDQEAADAGSSTEQ